MKRKIIEIDESLCNGCGECISACAEGALALVDGKARVVNDRFCDGFGDCLGECPVGALKIVEREADEFDFKSTLDHVRNLGGEKAVHRLNEVDRAHSAASRKYKAVNRPRQGIHPGGGCPGSMMRVLPERKSAAPSSSSSPESQVLQSELRQWPIQIHLVRPDAPYFHNKELVIMSTCAPIASPDVHWRFIRGRAVVVGCPKLDNIQGYVEKLADIFRIAETPSVTVVRMEVPCCGGLTSMTEQAAKASGRTDIVCREANIGIDGDFQGIREF